MTVFAEAKGYTGCNLVSMGKGQDVSKRNGAGPLISPARTTRKRLLTLASPDVRLSSGLPSSASTEQQK